MVIATGASANSQQALGTGVMGGMIAVVVLALLMVPVFFVVVQRVLARDVDREPADQAESENSGRAAGAGRSAALRLNGAATGGFTLMLDGE